MFELVLLRWSYLAGTRHQSDRDPEEPYLFSLGDSFFPSQGYFVTSWAPMMLHSTSLESLPLLEVLSFVLSHGSTVRSKESSVKALKEKRWRKCWRTRTLCCRAHLESLRKNLTLLFNVIYLHQTGLAFRSLSKFSFYINCKFLIFLITS